MTNTVLVTGGSGFIGSHLVERLAQQGDRVAVYDNFDPYYDREIKQANIGPSLAMGNVRLAEGDILDRDKLFAVFEAARPAKVVHLAARAGVRPSFENPQSYVDTNVTGTLNVLLACRKYAIERLVFASSSSVYGSASAAAQENVTPLRPLSPYGASKVAGEALCSAFSRRSGLAVTALRFFTVFGPRQRPDMAVNRFTRMIMSGETVPVYGDGTSRRDYTYISDTIAGIVAALDADLPGFNVFNLGRGQPIMLRDLLKLIEFGLDRHARLRFVEDQQGDPQQTCADITRAHAVLGYEPRVSTQNGVIRYTEWYLEQGRERVGSR
ncbi:MAG: SDR family NAD(P)-dependent oxidoreductase [Chloroflexota bacterium]